MTTQLLTGAVQQGLKTRFEELEAKKAFKIDDVAKGQEYVEAYVAFVHYVEGIHEAATRKAEGHHPEH